MPTRPAQPRRPATERCGTVLDHTREPDGSLNVITITSCDRVGRYSNQGKVDRRQRVYQNGGEAKNFIYRKLASISIPLDVWGQVRNDVDFLEMIDHDTHSFYRIDVVTAARVAQSYEAPGLGLRVAIPVANWLHLGPDWQPYRPRPLITVDPPLVDPPPIAVQDALF